MATPDPAATPDPWATRWFTVKTAYKQLNDDEGTRHSYEQHMAVYAKKNNIPFPTTEEAQLALLTQFLATLQPKAGTSSSSSSSSAAATAQQQQQQQQAAVAAAAPNASVRAAADALAAAAAAMPAKLPEYTSQVLHQNVGPILQTAAGLYALRRHLRASDTIMNAVRELRPNQLEQERRYQDKLMRGGALNNLAQRRRRAEAEALGLAGTKKKQRTRQDELSLRPRVDLRREQWRYMDEEALNERLAAEANQQDLAVHDQRIGELLALAVQERLKSLVEGALVQTKRRLDVKKRTRSIRLTSRPKEMLQGLEKRAALETERRLEQEAEERREETAKEKKRRGRTEEEEVKMAAYAEELRQREARMRSHAAALEAAGGSALFGGAGPEASSSGSSSSSRIAARPDDEAYSKFLKAHGDFHREEQKPASDSRQQQHDGTDDASMSAASGAGGANATVLPPLPPGELDEEARYRERAVTLQDAMAVLELDPWTARSKKMQAWYLRAGMR